MPFIQNNEMENSSVKEDAETEESEKHGSGILHKNVFSQLFRTQSMKTNQMMNNSLAVAARERHSASLRSLAAQSPHRTAVTSAKSSSLYACRSACGCTNQAETAWASAAVTRAGIGRNFTQAAMDWAQ